MRGVLDSSQTVDGDLATWRHLLVERELAAARAGDAELVELPYLKRRVSQMLSRREAEERPGLFIRDGSLVAAIAWGDGTHPLSGRLERHLLHVSHVVGEEEALLHVLREAAQRARNDGVDLLRMLVPTVEGPLEEGLLGMGFRRHYQVVRNFSVEHMPETDGWEWHRTRGPERAFVHDCLHRAIINGHVGPRPSGEMLKRVADLVQSQYRRLQTRRRISVVACVEGKPVSHALLEMKPARYGRGLDAFLADVFVARGQEGAGWARRLGLVSLSLAREARAVRVESIVSLVGTPDPERLLENLGRAGWWIDRDSWVLPLSRREQRAWRAQAAREGIL